MVIDTSPELTDQPFHGRPHRLPALDHAGLVLGERGERVLDELRSDQLAAEAVLPAVPHLLDPTAHRLGAHDSRVPPVSTAFASVRPGCGGKPTRTIRIGDDAREALHSAASRPTLIKQ